MNIKDKIIVALDVENKEKALELVKKLKGYVGVFKIGLQLFTVCGPEIVKEVQNLGGKVFLDLKFHDIPNTVAKAVEAAVKLNVYMLTIHAFGGTEMMRKAQEAAVSAAKKYNTVVPKILAVTVLTSLDENGLKELNVNVGNTKEQAFKLAVLSKTAGISGIVCSPNEVSDIRKAVGSDFTIVTPGVRPVGSDINDQKRIATPLQALQNGSNYLVIGRPITQADNPAEAAGKIIKDIEENYDK